MWEAIQSGPDSLFNYLMISAILFGLGVFAMASRRNAIGILMGVELILNAAGLNFVAFSRFTNHQVDGQVMTLFIIVLAAAEAVIALAMVMCIFKAHKTIDLDTVHDMSG